jgi:hypothetical protein
MAEPGSTYESYEDLPPEYREQVEQAAQDGLGLEAIITAILSAWIVSELANAPGIGTIARTAADTARAIAWLTAFGASTAGQRSESAIVDRLEQVVKPRVLSSVTRLRTQLGDYDQHNDTELVDQIVGPGLRRNRFFDSLISELKKNLGPDASAARADPYARKPDGSGAAGTQSWAERLSSMISTSLLQEAREKAAIESGSSQKVWISRSDNKVRPMHRDFHMQKKRALQPFKYPPDIEIMYPGDRSAPPNSWVRCRCVLLWMSP